MNTVLVTGASRGIGYAVSARLAAAGTRVVMVARTEAALRGAAAAVGGQPYPADVSVESDVVSLQERIDREIGAAPDAIVNAAGAFGIASLADTRPDSFDAQLAANLRGPFLITRAFLPAMLRRGSGHVINVGSVAGRLAFPGNAAYSASKFGLRGFHEVLAAELVGTGLRATLIEPSATDTPLWDPLDPDSRDDLPSRAQMLSADDVARAIVFTLEQPAGVEVSHLAIRASG